MNERKALIWAMYQAGKSFAEIGAELGIARGRIIDLYKQIQSQIPGDHEPLIRLGLDTRTLNALDQAGFKTVGDVVKIIVSNPEELEQIRNIEPTVYDEIREKLKEHYRL